MFVWSCSCWQMSVRRWHMLPTQNSSRLRIFLNDVLEHRGIAHLNKNFMGSKKNIFTSGSRGHLAVFGVIWGQFSLKTKFSGIFLPGLLSVGVVAPVMKMDCKMTAYVQEWWQIIFRPDLITPTHFRGDWNFDFGGGLRPLAPSSGVVMKSLIA